MDMILIVLLGLAMGLVFGVALEKSRVFEPGIIVGQMQLKNYTMLRVFLSAIVTGLLSLSLMNGLGLVELHPKAFMPLAQIVGGLILGLGMVLAGACPGTVFAQIGAGYKDAWFVLAGGFAGALGYGYSLPSFKHLLGQSELTTYADLFGAPFWLLALGLAGALAGILFMLERLRPSAEELGSDLGGA
ncbi:MAG: YeeE/YedE thiosulfate transporter family protein [Parvibaculum sp.]